MHGARGRRGGRPRGPGRLERMSETGFAPLAETVRCPDCTDNELSPPSTTDPDDEKGRKMGRRRDYRCETCKGWGTLPARGKERLDPYMTPLAQHS